jgi:hypothetical protein
MVPFAYFGIKSSALSLIVDLLIVCLAVVYVALIYWTTSDARRRVADPLLVGCAFLVSLVPFVGAVVYMIVRPPDFIEDARERELEIKAAEARLARLQTELCPHCDYPIERDYLRCPSCHRQLKERCASCSRPLDPTWSMCPFCEAPAPGAEPPRSSRRRRSRAEREEPPELEPAEHELEPPPGPRGRRSRREAPPRRSRSREGVLERDREARGSLDPEAIAAPDLLVDDPLLAPEDLLGPTIETDTLGETAEQGSTPLPATDAGSRREAARRSRRPPRPES